MKVTILDKENENDEDEIIIKCDNLDESLINLINSLKSGQSKMTFYKDSKIILINPKEILYFESVDDKTFAYTAEQVFETKSRIYQLENELSKKDFFRVSKSVIVNLNKILSLTPAFGGRFEAVLSNNYRIIISRMYVPHFKELLDL